MSLQDYSWMLHDAVRIDAFRRAVERAVGPGDIVAEIGAGLGTYSFFACRAGAARVYAIEDSAYGALETLAGRQDFGGRLKVIRGNSADITLPETADLIIYEDFSSAFLAAGMPGVVRDAAERLLKPGGRWLPEEVVLCGAFIECADKWEERAAWRKGGEHVEGLDFGPLAGWLLNSKVRGEFGPEALLTAPRDLRRYRFGNPEEKFDLAWNFGEKGVRSGTAHGVCVWFRLEFSGGTDLDNAPGADKTVYGQVMFPLSAPLRIEKDAPLEWSLDCVEGAGGDEMWWSWRVDSPGGVAEGTTFAGFPASMEKIRKNSGDHVPRLGSRQKIWKFILNEADGERAQEEIARKLFAAFSGEIADEKEALRLVTDILAE